MQIEVYTSHSSFPTDHPEANSHYDDGSFYHVIDKTPDGERRDTLYPISNLVKVVILDSLYTEYLASVKRFGGRIADGLASGPASVVAI